MLRAVYFNHQAPFQTDKIKYVIFKGVLTAKLHVKLLAA